MLFALPPAAAPTPRVQPALVDRNHAVASTIRLATCNLLGKIRCGIDSHLRPHRSSDWLVCQYALAAPIVANVIVIPKVGALIPNSRTAFRSGFGAGRTVHIASTREIRLGQTNAPSRTASRDTRSAACCQDRLCPRALVTTIQTGDPACCAEEAGVTTTSTVLVASSAAMTNTAALGAETTCPPVTLT